MIIYHFTALSNVDHIRELKLEISDDLIEAWNGGICLMV